MTISSQLHTWLASDTYTQRPSGIRPEGTADPVTLNGVKFNVLEHYNNPRTGYQQVI